MKKIMENQIKEFQKVYGQGNVHPHLLIRQVSSTNELKFHESLAEILPESKFKKIGMGLLPVGMPHSEENTSD